MSDYNRFEYIFKDCDIHNVHIKLMEIICHDYLYNEENNSRLARFRTKCLRYLTAPADQNAKSAADILERLRQKGIFGFNNYGHLRGLVDDVDADLPKAIDAATDRIAELGASKVIIKL